MVGLRGVGKTVLLPGAQPRYRTQPDSAPKVCMRVAARALETPKSCSMSRRVSGLVAGGSEILRQAGAYPASRSQALRFRRRGPDHRCVADLPAEFPVGRQASRATRC